MELLDKEYGNPHKISHSYLKELRDWPNIKGSDRQGWKKLHRFLCKCQAFKKTGSLQQLDNADKIGIIVMKLDPSFQDKWTSIAEKTERSEKREPNFNDLVAFIDFHAACVNHSAYSQEAMKNFKVNVTLPCKSVTFEKNCNFCSNTVDHDTDVCPIFLALGVEDRYKKVYQYKLCFGCMSPITDDHRDRSYPQRKEEHPTCIHKEA